MLNLIRNTLLLVLCLFLALTSTKVNLTNFFFSDDFYDKVGSGVTDAWLDYSSNAYIRRALDPQRRSFLSADFAKKSALLNPVDARSYLISGLSMEKAGDLASAKDMMKLSDALGPRKPTNQLEIAKFWFRHNDLDKAIVHWSVSIEELPWDFQEKSFRDIVALIDNPHFFIALTSFIEKDRPLWWPSFFIFASQQSKDIRLVSELYRVGLIKGSAGTEKDTAIKRAFTERLISERRWQDAYDVWTTALIAQDTPTFGSLFNGGFEQDEPGFGFGWVANKDHAFAVGRSRDYFQAGSQSLEIRFTGSRPKQLSVLSQRLLLKGAAHLFSGKIKTSYLRAGDGVQWIARCDDGTIMARSQLFTGTAEWRPFELSFNLPASGCVSQVIDLVIDPGLNSPFAFAGSAWFDELRVD